MWKKLVKRIKGFDPILVSQFVTSVLYSATYPYINKVLISNIDENWVAIHQMVCCISTVIIGSIWNRKKKIFELFPIFCIMEVILIFGSTLYTILTRDLVSYYVLDTIVTSVVTRNIICGINKIFSSRYTGDEREEFDNNSTSVYGVATIIGSLVAMILKLNFDVMLIIAAFSNTLDNAFYIYVYVKDFKEKGDAGD